MKRARLLFIAMVTAGAWMLNGCGGDASGAPTAAQATHFSVGVPASAGVGTAVTVSVTAVDASGSLVSSYSGQVSLSSSDVHASLPLPAILTNGAGNFSVTFNTPGTQTVSATDTLTKSLTGTSNAISVSGQAAHFGISAPATATAGVSASFTVTALDASGAVVTAYSGTVHFSSSDTQAVLPANSALPNGVGTFSVTFKTTGNQSITAADTATASIVGTLSSINVEPQGSLVLTSGPPNGTLGAAFGSLGFVTSQGCTVTFTGWVPHTSGGVAPFHWSISAAPGSSLPPGLSVSIAQHTCGGSTRCCVTVSARFFGGTPTTTGTYSVTVVVSDSESPPAQVQANYNINIAKSASSASPASADAAVPAVKHHHYKLIDLGTFGGPQSHVNPGSGTDFGNFASVLNSQGAVTGWADTSTPDPFPDFCLSGECFVVHAFEWKNGSKTDLGVLPGGASSETNWITSNGIVVGLSENGEIDPLVPGFPEIHATLWRNGSITDLGTLPEGGFESIANAANSRGQVVGFATNTIADLNSMFGLGFQARAFLWQNGEMQDLGTLPGGTDAEATLINENGVVVGWSYNSLVAAPSCQPGFTLTTGSFVWDKEKGLRDIGGLGGSCTIATDLNKRGQIVGSSTFSGDASQHAFLWDNDTFQDLGGSLGGNFEGAFSVNEQGEAVGFATLPGDTLFHATLWTGVGSMLDLGVLGDDPSSNAASINSRNQIVGSSGDFSTDPPTSRVFLWENGDMVDLNALASATSTLHMEFTQTINDRGEIAGSGVDAQGNEHAFLAIPCDAGHPGVEGCDYSTVEGNAVVARAPAPIVKNALPTAAARSATIRHLMWLSRSHAAFWRQGLAPRPHE